MTPSKQSSANMPKASEDRVSMLSAGSSDNSALLDSASNVSAKNNSLGNLRKFTTGVGRGQAREIREACTKAMNVNPLRKCAKPEPIDYENFIVEKSAQLDNEKNREIILFPRDDVTEGVRRHFGSEKKATEVYGFTDSIESVEWLLARDCLYLYNSRGTVINYNYSHKYGDYDEEVNNTGNLTSPRFEIDQRLDEERQELQEQECESFKESRVICEGMVLQLSSDNSLLEKFRNGKKRYCRVKHETEKNNVVVELMKVSGNNKTLDLTFLAKSTMINNNKNKSVIVLSDKSSMNEECMSGSKGDSKQKMILLAGGDEGLDITKWFFTIDKSIKICQVNRNSQTVDCASITSEKADSGQDVISSNGDFNVDELNELGSISSATSAKFQKGKNAAAKILQPPVVIRNNLFKLYHELSPLPSLQEKQGNVLTRASNLDKHFSREINRASARKGSMSNQQRPSELTLTTSISPTTKLARRISIEITDLNFKALISPTTSEQIEPFVVKAFIYDSRQNLRLSEEFSIGFSTPEHDEWLRESGVYGGDRLNSSSPSMNTSYSSAEFPTTISLENILTKNNMKVLFTFANIHEFIFLVVKVERVFSNTSMDPYFKPFTDLKLAVKYKKAVTTAISKLGQYRTCCAWGVRSIFKGDCDEKMKLYKCEGKFTESDLCKNLNEFHRLEKNGKIVAYPQASLSTRIEDGVRGSAIGQCLNSSLRIIPEESTPLSESPNQSMASKVNLCSPKQQLYFLYEIQAFGDVITRPYSSIVNLLYVYPIHLLYGNQKSFSKARNIICSVSYVSMSGDSNGDNVNRLVDTSNPAGPFLPSQECSVQYHEQSPQFNSEMKIILPVNLKPSDHLLFSFKHISVSAALSDKKNRESIVSNVGYAWLPLSQKETFIMKDDVQEFEIPVSMNLPDNYTNSFVSKGLCDAKYIDNGKGLFKVRMRLISSLISPEPRIQSFFQNCLYLQNCLKGKTMNIPHSKSHDETINNVKKNSFKDKHPNSVEVSHSASIQNNSQLNDTSIIHSSTTEIQQFIERVGRRCDSLLTVDPDKITPFLYVIINRILSMMPLMTITNASNQMIKCLFGIIDKMHSIHKSHLFKKYVLGIFSNETCAIKSNDSVHEALIVGLTPFLNNSESDTELVAIIFKHLKVVLDVVLKSMSLHVVSNGLNKVSRPERFSPAFLESIRSFVHVLVNMICEKCQILPRENLIHANASLMYFLRGCLSLTDRGYILRQFSYSALKWDKYENSILRSLKFDLIQNLVFHEHYLQLCLPLLCDKNLNILRIDGLKESSTPPAQDNSSGLFVRFFGQLFSNTSNISELASMNTYTPYAENFILNELYCHVHFPIGMLFQELAAVMKEPKENRKKVIKLLRNILAKHSFDDRYSSSVIQSRIATLYSPLIRFVLENIIEIEHSASTLALSNDSYNSNLKQSELPLTPLTQKTHKNITHSNDSSKISNSNSQSTLKDFNVSTPNTPLKNIYRSGEDKMLLSIIHEQPSPSNGVTALSETLDRNEVRDLLVSVLYVIHNLPPNIFRAVINSFDDSRLTRNDSSKKNGCEKVSAVELLCRQFELILQFFRHEPQEVFVARYLTQAKKTRPNAKVSIQIPETGHENDPMVKDEQQKAQLAYMQECNLIQEVSLITLAAAQTLANHISTQAKLLSFEEIEKAFVKLLQIQIKFLNEENPENVRLHALAAVAIFVTIFQKRLFINGTLNPLADLIEALLLQLNSRLVSVQNSAAALLQLIYRTSFDLLSSMSSAFYRSDENGLRKLSFNSVNSSCLIEKLGRPGMFYYLL
uniref:C2 DOCK-type domain-containing protein n=1 Tax=Rhabditophanes sp. KR3021 TaxID=114890 RepID=A0AC35TUR8_9BILA